MAYLLDTCTISEMVAVKPNPNVLSWFQSQNEKALFLSVITIAEIEKGIYGLVASRKRTLLETWLFDDLAPSFQGRILKIDRNLMTTWAKASADLKTKGIVRPSLIR